FRLPVFRATRGLGRILRVGTTWTRDPACAGSVEGVARRRGAGPDLPGHGGRLADEADPNREPVVPAWRDNPSRIRPRGSRPAHPSLTRPGSGRDAGPRQAHGPPRGGGDGPDLPESDRNQILETWLKDSSTGVS